MALQPTAFLSPAPEIRLVNRFDRGFDNAVATARTCYSSRGIVTPEEVAGDGEGPEAQSRRRARRDALARDIYLAGHHTTFQHAHFQFSLANVSRQFVWSFLHSHPFYNSEQVSQRYVAVREGTYAVPPLAGPDLARYRATAERMQTDYRALGDLLLPLARAEFYRRFPARRHQAERWEKDVQKRAQEVARYVLPVATFAYLYHTVSAITLFRYWRLAEQFDAPLEQRLVVGRMVEAVLAVDPDYRTVLEAPIPHEETPEHQAFVRFQQPAGPAGPAPGFRAAFDAGLEGRTSRLIDWPQRGEATLADSVREVLGATAGQISDGEAIDLVLDPASNRTFGEALRLSTHSKLTRCLSHLHYSFRKRLSHAADSQDQRHRMTPASRPVLAAQIDEEPDVVIPALVREEPAVERAYLEACARAWEGIGHLVRSGVPREHAHYLLPNAVAVRFTESADLLHLHHKLTLRLCYNAQEEIWRASLDEATQIRELHPRVGCWLLPPCGLRDRSATRPICPEGARYCGVPVWRLDLADYSRVI